MDKLIYLNLQSWPDSFKKSIYFDTYFFASSILSFLKKSYDVMAITDVFYFRLYILNYNFGLNKGKWKWSLGKVCQNLYVYGIGLFSYLAYDHFWKFLAGELYFLLLKVDHAQTKSGNGAIGFQRI